jgi:hypothetical protein
MPSEALEALRRLAARVSQAPTTARSPDIVKFEGSTGSGVSTTPNPVEKHGFLGVPPGTPDENVRGSRDSSEPETVAPGTPGTPTENLMGSIPDGSKEAVFQRLDDTGTIRTPGSHENNKGGNEIETARKSCEPDADVAADLAWASLSPSTTLAVIAEPNGRATAYVRPPSGKWGPMLVVRPARFETQRRPDRFVMPTCTGWCEGCGQSSTWRPDPPSSPNASLQRWCCVRCRGLPPAEPTPSPPEASKSVSPGLILGKKHRFES